jgi:hypothetical protein
VYLPPGWDYLCYYDIASYRSTATIAYFEGVAQEHHHDSPKINFFIRGTKWKDAFLAVAADPDNTFGPWRPSPDNKVQIEWFDDGDDPTCPPCVICGELQLSFHS